MYGCFQANILAVSAVRPRLVMGLSTHTLTADEHLIAFGVCQELVGDETPASNQ